LLAANQDICKRQMAEKQPHCAPPNCAALPLWMSFGIAA
jgi:hypothetical protein